MDRHESFDASVARLGFTGAVQQLVDESFVGAHRNTQELFDNRQIPPEDESAIAHCFGSHYELLEERSMQKLTITLWMNNPGDWSAEINGCRHEHISSKILEGLAECMLLSAQESLIEGASPDYSGLLGNASAQTWAF
jgi:hypothetical protein